jgi:hypothetical protein
MSKLCERIDSNLPVVAICSYSQSNRRPRFSFGVDSNSVSGISTAKKAFGKASTIGPLQPTHLWFSNADVRTWLNCAQASADACLNDEFSALLSTTQANNLPDEAEARWRLVETAWSLELSRSLLSVSYDIATETLFTVDSHMRRKAVTGSRTALNGYQKGKCFYCFADLQLNGTEVPDVDHFFSSRS